MYSYAFYLYLLWRYSYILEYGLSAITYTNKIRHYMTDPVKVPLNDSSRGLDSSYDDWVLIQD